MFNLAIIKKNKVGIDMEKISDESSSSPFEYLKDLIKDNISFVTVESTDEMMHLIVSTINLNGDRIASTTHCHEESDNIYQICHLNPKRNNLPENQDDINYLASFLTTGRELVYGDAVYIKSIITENGTCMPTDIGVDEIVNILYRKIRPVCVLMKTDGTIHEIKFLNNPFSDSLNRDISDFDLIEVPILEHNVILYFEKSPNDKTLNKKASRLIGTSKVRGDVIVVLMETENSFGSINKSLIDNLLVVSSGDMSNRDITDEERHKDETINGLSVIINKHRILQKRLSEYKKKCSNPKCNSESDLSPNVCTGCYRVTYCSKECQSDDWSSHKKGCGYGKDFLNK